MNTTAMSTSPTTIHKLADGCFLTVTRNPRAGSGQSIITSANLSKGHWPLASLAVIMSEFQKHADEERVSFDQVLNLPGGLDLKFGFAPGKPPVPLPTADAAPRQKTIDDIRSETIAAIQKRVTPELFAEAFAQLPGDAQRRVASTFFIEPPVRRVTRIVRGQRRSKSQPKP